MPSTTSPDQPSAFSPFNKRNRRNKRKAYAYGRTGLVGPMAVAPRVSGLDTTGMMNWAKENKWYLLGGALLLGAAVAIAKH